MVVTKRIPNGVAGGKVKLTPAERSARYRAKHPEKVKAALEKYRAANRDKVNEAQKLRARERRAADPEGSRASQRNWYANNPRKRKAQQLWRYFRMLHEEYDRLLKHQNAKCFLCERGDVQLCVDHSHSTGEIRGLLCHACNHAIHRHGDTIKFYLRVIAYLENPPARKIKIKGVGERNPRR